MLVPALMPLSLFQQLDFRDVEAMRRLKQIEPERLMALFQAIEPS